MLKPAPGAGGPGAAGYDVSPILEREPHLRPRSRRYLTLAAGSALLVAGGVLVVLPGPGLPLILLGLAVLGREAAWARRVRYRILSFVRRAPRPMPAATPVPAQVRRDDRRA